MSWGQVRHHQSQRAVDMWQDVFENGPENTKFDNLIILINVSLGLRFSRYRFIWAQLRTSSSLMCATGFKDKVKPRQSPLKIGLFKVFFHTIFTLLFWGIFDHSSCNQGEWFFFFFSSSCLAPGVSHNQI